jgi:hypothetical protein
MHEPTPSATPANTCPVCRARIGWRGLNARALAGPRGTRQVRVCPHCAAPLRVARRGGRAAQFTLAALAWGCLMIAGVKGHSATSALAVLGYLGVMAAIALQVAAPRWYVRDAR